MSIIKSQVEAPLFATSESRHKKSPWLGTRTDIFFKLLVSHLRIRLFFRLYSERVKSVLIPNTSKSDSIYDRILECHTEFKKVKSHIGRFAFISALKSMFKSYTSNCTIDNISRFCCEVERSSAGIAIRRHVRKRSLFPRHCRIFAVLTLPETYNAYSSTKSRQAYRTNVNKAKLSGVSCQVSSQSEFIRSIESLILKKSDIKYLAELRRACSMKNTERWVCSNVNGEDVALALVVVSKTTAVLLYLCASTIANDANARWALSGQIISSLIDRGVKYLIADPIAFTSPGNVYFQRRLGYKPALLSIRHT